MKYRKKPIPVDAWQWFGPADHPAVSAYVGGDGQCFQCDHSLGEHGRIRTHEGLFDVCPGDWIIKGGEGEHYAVKPDVFKKTYEEVK